MTQDVINKLFMKVKDRYTLHLLHCDGNTGDLTVPDAKSGGTWSGDEDSGGVDESTKVFGRSSFKITDYGDLGANTSSTIFDIYASTDFTVDTWVKYTEFQDWDTLYLLYASRGSNEIDFNISRRSGNTYYQINLTGGGGGTPINITTGDGIVYNTWMHLALVRNGNIATVYKNGEVLMSGAYSGIYSLAAPPYPRIGSSCSNDFWIDEWRFSKGIARWTAPFVPPTAPYS
jgi:hypothetical protein